MDGFLPMLYKSFKKNKIRRRYERLSSGAADSADFYDSEDAHLSQPEPVKPHHRRYGSVHVDHVKSRGSASELENLDRGFDKPKQLVNGTADHESSSPIIMSSQKKYFWLKRRATPKGKARRIFCATFLPESP